MNTTATSADLSALPPEALALYALASPAELDPVVGIVAGVRTELETVGELLEATGTKSDFDAATLTPLLESWARRLDVAVEMANRAARVQPPPVRGST